MADSRLSVLHNGTVLGLNSLETLRDATLAKNSAPHFLHAFVACSLTALRTHPNCVTLGVIETLHCILLPTLSAPLERHLQLCGSFDTRRLHRRIRRRNSQCKVGW